MERPGVNANGALILPSREQIELLKEFGDMHLKSGMLPAGLKTWQAVAVTIQHGMDLGIPMSTAIQQIYVINGKPTCSAALMASLIYRDHGDGALRLIESTDQTCTYAYKRRSWSDYAQYTYTMEDAKRAKLDGKDTWKQFPKSMLRARCMADIAHANFQDTIGGLYLRDEIEAAPQPSSNGSGSEAPLHGEVIEGQVVERATREQLLQIKDVADVLGLSTEELQFKVGKSSRDLTPAEADALYRELVAVVDQRNSEQTADPVTGELFRAPQGTAGNDVHTQ